MSDGPAVTVCGQTANAPTTAKAAEAIAWLILPDWLAAFFEITSPLWLAPPSWHSIKVLLRAFGTLRASALAATRILS